MNIRRQSSLSIVLTYLFFVNHILFGQAEFNGFIHKSVENDQDLPVQILYPEEMQAGKKYPLLLFLHGAGERGNDNQKQLAHFHELLLNAVNSGKYPAIVVFPQCPEEDYWANAKIDRYPDHLDIVYQAGGAPTNALKGVMAMMDSLTQLHFVDQNRVYVGGLSMGGMGTFELLYRRPDMFAAAFPICGGAHPETAEIYADKVKIWVFHGDQDPIVLPQFSVEMVDALRAAGADPKFTLYKNVKHDSWKNARQEPDLMPWLFAQRKKTPIRLHSYLAENAILQRDQPIKIIGQGNPGSEIKIHWKDSTYETTTDAWGDLYVELPAEHAGGPYRLSVADQDTTIFIENLLIGDVWFASGQSNMEWTLEKSEGGKEEAGTAGFDHIRFAKAPRAMEFRPVNDWQSTLVWESANGSHVGNYSGVAYFFAKKIHLETGVPIGIIDASWGGTMIETWMSEQALRPFEVHDIDLDLLKNRLQPLKESERKANAIFELWKENEYKKGIGFYKKWFESQPDLSDWKPIHVPGYWEDQLPEYAEFDGAMWYRRNFDVPNDFLPHDIRMWLSQIDDHNMCWINGHYIGETYFSKTWTNYLIPQGILKEKDNEIVLRIFDVEGKGGPTGLETYFDFYPNENKSVRERLNGTWLVKPGESYTGDQSIQLANIGHSPNHYPTLLYNGMVSPYRHFPIKGVIWYQGESNKTNAYFYRHLLQAMISDWRRAWNLSEMPFYFVQIAAYDENSAGTNESASAELRESQAFVRSIPHTGMATAIDLGDPVDIHPLRKKEVGERLALHALKNQYGFSELTTDGPEYLSHFRKGNKLVIEFKQSGGLKTIDGLPPKAFFIASETGPFVEAKTELQGDKVIIWHPEIKKPRHVRYAWADYPVVNIVNEAELPLYPFRTDDRKLITQDQKKTYK